MNIFRVAHESIETLLSRIVIRFFGFKVDSDATERQEDVLIVLVFIARLVNLLLLVEFFLAITDT